MNVKLNFVFSFAVLMITSSALFSQSHELDWVVPLGAEGREEGKSIVTDVEGNVYTVGYFENTIDFDPGENTYNLTSAGFFDIFIQKLNPNGEFLWAKRIGGITADVANDITIDATGDLYITGTFTETVDFDPGEDTYNLTTGATTPHVTNIFVLKLDADGDFIWAKHMVGDGYSSAQSITTDTNGHILVTGGFSGTVDFDPGEGTVNLTSSGNQDLFILKIDSNGNLIWVKQMSGASKAFSIDTDANSNILTTGYFWETVDFDPNDGTVNLTSHGFNDIFVQKLDVDGNLLWVKQMGSEKTDQGIALTVDMDGNVYITGGFSGTVDFNPDAETLSLTSNGQSDIFIQKLDPNGNLLWVKQIGGTHYDIGNAIKTDANGDVYILGNFNNTIDFDPGEGIFNMTGSSHDMFLLKLTSDGSFIWAKNSFGNFESGSSANSMVIDGDTIYCTGSFTGMTDFNPLGDAYELTSKGYWDIFILKFSLPSLNLVENSLLDNFIIHPNPTKGKFSIEFKSLQTSMDVQLYNLAGQLLMEKRFQDLKILPLEIQQADGIYLLELKDGQGRKATVKLVKN
ncbi:SBBP repeat-containing protein [Gelidibacter maritimus]|uniref:T9SS type A sorting domain-containing protein n=1 Tax=Gelidibacter maritimus TaxID=2761487 RepID=A0A7W2M483_9FLAO|nr:SBBP repeat-containing protein [Gelidibacter maritimus]MBA6152342.1 T9SS type A sorting domain-containing protein [Gelidibacter maritimus]